MKPSASKGGASEGPECKTKILTFPPSISVVLPATISRSQPNRGPLLNVDLIFACRLVIVHPSNCGNVPQISPTVGGNQLDGCE